MAHLDFVNKQKKLKKIDNNLPIGINDPFGVNINPLTKIPYQNLYRNELKTIDGELLPATYMNLAKIWTSKLVYQNKDLILEGIKNNQVLLTKAGTGVGKTVIIPKLALHNYNYNEKVITTIPKKIITKSTAMFAAQCMDVNIGEEVGYYYKGENMTNRNGKDTKLVFTTTGSLISKITGDDPLLKEYKCVIIDEAHERSVQTDILLLLLKEALLKRTDLKVIIMSATINIEVFRNYFPKRTYGFKEIDVGNILSYPIQDFYLDKIPADWILESVKIIINILKTTQTGDILVFGKSKGDGSKLCQLLDIEIRKMNDVAFNPFCISLASGVSKEDEELAKSEIAYLSLKNNKGVKYTRKIVVSTNVAESSLTVDGVEFVIDSGLQFTDGYYPDIKARSLLPEIISKASSIQRRGRCGRTKPGICYHLYSKNDYNKMKDYPIPDIQKTDLTSYFLDLLRLPYIKNIADLKKLLDKFISPPHTSFINDGLNTLTSLGCITNNTNSGVITQLGLIISKFRGIKPEMGRTLITSYYYKCSTIVSKIIALMILCDGQIEYLFLPYFENKKISMQQQKEQRTKYEKSRKEVSNNNGDILTIYNLIKLYDTKLLSLQNNQLQLNNQYGGDNTMNAINDINDINNTNEIALSINEVKAELDIDDIKDAIPDTKTTNAWIQHKMDKWCKEHHINNKIMKRMNDTSKQLKRVLIDSMRNIKHSHNYTNTTNTTNTTNKPPQGTLHGSMGIELYKNLDDDNKVIYSFISGYMTHLLKNVSGNTYESCISTKKKGAIITYKSFLKNKTEHIIADELFMSNENAPLKCNINLAITNAQFNIIKDTLKQHNIICPTARNINKQTTQKKNKLIINTSRTKKGYKNKGKQNNKHIYTRKLIRM